jgi:hypothetical protein
MKSLILIFIKYLALSILIFGSIVSIIIAIMFFVNPQSINDTNLAGIGCLITGTFGWMYGAYNLFKNNER